MNTFLQRLGGLVLGILSGFDRLVFRGTLRQLYSPEGMHCYLDANHVLRKNLKEHCQQVTQRLLQASLVDQAKQLDAFEYLNSSKIDKDQVARGIAARRGVTEGLVCVLQCVEQCWSFVLRSPQQRLVVRGQERRCSHLYHYYLHPEFGWMFVRLQTWFPFEVIVYINGREWLARQMDREGLAYRRSDNKFLWIEDWTKAQALAQAQLQTNWPTALDRLLQTVHPLHPTHLGRLPIQYNWTVRESEWATDVAFAKREHLQAWYERWLRQALLSYDQAQVLRFFGHSGRPLQGQEVRSELKRGCDGKRIKHWVGINSLKAYDHESVLRVETTIVDPKAFRAFRTSADEPEGVKKWRILRRSVADLYRRADVSEKANDRYLEALAGVAETKKVADLAEPLCQRVEEPSKKAAPTTAEGAAPSNPVKRKVRGLNPLSAEDGALLTAIANPCWMLEGLRNRDLVVTLYPNEARDTTEKRRRSARITRLIRLMRAHGLLRKVPGRHRYQVPQEARAKLQTLLAARNANANELTAKAA
jgi:hypothetical protein